MSGTRVIHRQGRGKHARTPQRPECEQRPGPGVDTLNNTRRSPVWVLTPQRKPQHRAKLMLWPMRVALGQNFGFFRLNFLSFIR